MKRKFLSTILCILIATCTLTLVACGGTGNGNNPVIPNGIYARINENGTANSTGKYILFGSYPQTEVTDSTLKSTLDNMRGTLPTSSNRGTWTDYGYYISGEIESYMWYQDVEYNGEKYRGVYFTQYRPYYTTYRSSASNSEQDYNGYSTNNVYWFKFEPIKWRILSESNGEALILCEMIIDSQAYQNSYNDKWGAAYATDEDGNIITDGSGNQVYANNYAYSTIRAWLNDNFYNTAFNDLQKQIILITEVDNSVESTGYSSNPFACENTNDKIFLLSAKEVETREYVTHSMLVKQDTDYAKVQGCWTYTYTSTDYEGKGVWWLRSPYANLDDCARNCHNADLMFQTVNYTCDGVVPALNIKLS